MKISEYKRTIRINNYKTLNRTLSADYSALRDAQRILLVEYIPLRYTIGYDKIQHTLYIVRKNLEIPAETDR